MKHEVKAGKELVLNAEVTVHGDVDGDFNVKVQVNVQPNAPEPKMEFFSWKKVGIILLVTAVPSIVAAATILGVVTGDFSVLKDIAEVGGKAITAGMAHVTTPSK